MNKTELAVAVAEKAGMTKNDAKKAVDAALEAIGEALMNNENVALLGFGNFTIVERGERKGINPATKESIVIPARKAIKFKPASAIADNLK